MAHGERQAEMAPGYSVMANDTAGSARRGALREASGVLAERHPVRLRWVRGDDDLDDALDEARRHGAVPVVAGGDGTVHVVVNRLAARGELERPLGIVPAGTGNDLARTLAIPLDAVQAALAVQRGGTRPMTAVHIQPERGAARLCVNNAHIGVGAGAAVVADRWKARIGRLAYPAAAVVCGHRAGGQPLRVEADGVCLHDGSALAVVVTVGAHGGGGHSLAPGATPERSLLEVLVVADRPRRERFSLALASLGRSLAEAPGVIVRSARCVTVEALAPERGPPVDAADSGCGDLAELVCVLDGEVVTVGSALRARAVPAAWTWWGAG